MIMRVRKTNAFREFCDNGLIRLYSYNTLVCEVNAQSMTIVLGPYARCSRTTINHLKEFLKSFGVSYFTAKKCLIDKTFSTVEHENGFTIIVSEHPRFNYKPTYV